MALRATRQFGMATAGQIRLAVVTPAQTPIAGIEDAERARREKSDRNPDFIGSRRPIARKPTTGSLYASIAMPSSAPVPQIPRPERRPEAAVTSAGTGRGLDRADGAERPSDRRRAVRHAAPAGGSNRLMSVDELAAYLGVPKKTVYGCWRQWGLQGYRVGRYLRFRERQVEEWLQSREV